MQNKRLIKALALACLTAATLAACGGSDDSPPAPTTPPNPTTPTNPTEPAKPEMRCAP
ncbi:hypothetical protein DJFAAGMI_02335 [Comamonas sp. PE63]|uniref:Uncharacterized protein n=1 Tax=Comamonas brasiliensis TaxID=1812482 RepID=A0ABS5LSW1_9BURK|nr:hypothetical protein [Comamonas sp. PE63]MBS3019590.1 hypothetical protein [Comamonas sp. PE63]